ncbi:MAG: effector binding domain-containing protein [Methanomicrobiales archaeon]|jgi:predicted transcriptional regulator YdeE|nr:effector binding domain-containing protein [Methanomicrobiales archaeon]
MQIRFVEKGGFHVCGYSIETSLEENQIMTVLYNDYFNTEKAALIDNVAKNKAAGYYGLMWYLEGQKRYRYLLGKEVVNLSVIPARAEVKEIPATLYAVATFEKGYDAVKAWTNFFFEEIPEAGFAPNYEHGFFFEYYPDGVNGKYELWTPVVRADV